MKLARAAAFSLAAGITVAFFTLACEEREATSPAGGDASSPSTHGDEDGSVELDDVEAMSCERTYVQPDLNGTGPCGTHGFGAPAVTFGPVDVSKGTEYSGTTLEDGIYDAVIAERASGSDAGSWRETFVVKDDRFTRIRQVDLGTGNGPGPVRYRSGTFAYDGDSQTIKLVYDCAEVEGTGAEDAGVDQLPSDAVVFDDCNAQYRYGAANVRITLRRRR